MLTICAKTSKALNTLAKKSPKLPVTIPVLEEYIGLGGAYAEVVIEPDETVVTGEEGTTAGTDKSHSSIGMRVSKCLIEFCSLSSTEPQNLSVLVAAGVTLPRAWRLLNVAENRLEFAKL